MADYFVNLNAAYGSGAGTAGNPWSVAAFDNGSNSRLSDAGTNNNIVKAGDRVRVSGTLTRWEGIQIAGKGGNGGDCDPIDECDLDNYDWSSYIQIIGEGALVSAANYGNIFVGHGSKFIRVSGFEVTQNQSFREGGTNCQDPTTSDANPANNVTTSDMMLINSSSGIAHHIVFDNNHLHDFPDGSGINVTLHPSNQAGWDFVRIEANHVHDGGQYDYRGPQGITALRGGNVGGCSSNFVKLVVWRNHVHDIIQLVNSALLPSPFDVFVTDGHCLLFGSFSSGKNGKMLVDYNICHNSGAGGIGIIGPQNTDWYVRNNTIVDTGWYVAGDSGNVSGRLNACTNPFGSGAYTDKGGFSITSWEGTGDLVELCNNLVIQPQSNINSGYKTEGPSGSPIIFGTTNNNWSMNATSNNISGVVNQSAQIVLPAGDSPNSCGTTTNANVYGAGKVTQAPVPCQDYYGNPITNSTIPVGACAGAVIVDPCDPITFPNQCPNVSWDLNLQTAGGVAPFTYTGGDGDIDSSPIWHGDSTQTAGGTKTVFFTDGQGRACQASFDVVDGPTCTVVEPPTTDPYVTHVIG